MIQRVQSIFLFLASAAFFLPYLESISFATVEGDLSAMTTAKQSMLSDGVFSIDDNGVLVAIAGIGGLLCLIALFLYKNRRNQLKFGRIALALAIVFLLTTLAFFYSDYQLMTEGEYGITIEYGFLSPVLSIIFLILAIRFINKDEKLVKSMDRLR